MALDEFYEQSEHTPLTELSRGKVRPPLERDRGGKLHLQFWKPLGNQHRNFPQCTASDFVATLLFLELLLQCSLILFGLVAEFYLVVDFFESVLKFLDG